MPLNKKFLKVDMVIQPADKLCWAASMKMILDGMGSRIQMGDLVDTSFKVQGVEPPLSEALKEAINNSLNQCSIGSFTDDSRILWNDPIPTFELELTNRRIQYFDTIFLGSKCYSIEDFTISLPAEADRIWELIRNQITQKRPMILIIENRTQTHAVVIKGYWQKRVDGQVNRYIYVNDPLASNPCMGEAYSLHFDNLLSRDFAVKAKSLIHSIRNQNDYNLLGTCTFEDLDVNVLDDNIVSLNGIR